MPNFITGGPCELSAGERKRLVSWKGKGPACLYVSCDLELYYPRALAADVACISEDVKISIIEVHGKENPACATTPVWQRRQMPLRGFVYPFLADSLECYAEYIPVSGGAEYGDRYPLSAGVVPGEYKERLIQADYSAVLAGLGYAQWPVMIPVYCRQFRAISSAPGTLVAKSGLGHDLATWVLGTSGDWKPLPLGAGYLVYTPVIGPGEVAVEDCDRPIVEFR